MKTTNLKLAHPPKPQNNSLKNGWKQKPKKMRRAKRVEIEEALLEIMPCRDEGARQTSWTTACALSPKAA